MNLPQVTQDYLAHGASNGNRNTALFNAACQFRDARHSLGEALGQLVARATADGLPKPEAEKTIRSAYTGADPRDPCLAEQPASYHANGNGDKPPAYRRITFQGDKLPSPMTDAAITFLQTFGPGQFIAIGHGIVKKDDTGKLNSVITPSKGRSRETWMADIQQRGMETVFPYVDGLYVRVNPMKDASGQSDKDVADYQFALIESDEGPLEFQLAAHRRIGLPIRSLTSSGGRSINGVVQIDATDEATYKERVAILHQFCREHLGLTVDEKNSNPSRYCRMPGGRRTRRDRDTLEKILDEKGKPIIDTQDLLGINIPGKPWDEWVQDLPIDDGLPDIESPEQFLSRRMELDPYLIEGLLREKSKMNFTSQSKGRKTWLQINQALCIGSGKPWLDHPCNRAPVLYVNLELKASTLNNRVLDICEAMGIDPVHGHDVDFWNLRGKSADIAVMVKRMLSRMRQRQYKMVYLDPAYKCLGWRDENKAGDITNFMNEIEKVAEEGGASICVTGHAPKGDVSKRNPNDLQSGSGVWARDPDVVASFLDCEDQDILSVHGEDCITVQFSGMREDVTPKPFAAKWELPMFRRITGAVEVKKGPKCKYSTQQMMEILGEQAIKRSVWAKQANEKIGVVRSTAYLLIQELETSKKVFENSEGLMERWATR
jgi:RecA-family ATPase